jgi:cyanophycinase-like exopeptidase
MMAEGYERGFSFLPGSAIDQHFAQRQRQADLLTVIHRHPGLLGIGLDEGTAIVVRQSKAEVIGQHSAHFLSGKQLAEIPAGELPTSAEDAKRFYVTVETGGAIDLGTLIADQP